MTKDKTVTMSRELLEKSVSTPRNNAEFQAQVLVVEEIRAILAAPIVEADGMGEAACPCCNGSGEGWILSDASPDADNIQVDCQECNGRGSLLGAYESMKTQLHSLGERYVKAGGDLFFMRSKNEQLTAALKFYAERDHYCTDDGLNWGSCSGEPSNILWHEEQPWFIEDGTVARSCLDKVKELNQ